MLDLGIEPKTSSAAVALRTTRQTRRPKTKKKVSHYTCLWAHMEDLLFKSNKDERSYKQHNMILTIVSDENVRFDIHNVIKELLYQGQLIFFIEHYE